MSIAHWLKNVNTKNGHYASFKTWTMDKYYFSCCVCTLKQNHKARHGVAV